MQVWAAAKKKYQSVLIVWVNLYTETNSFMYLRSSSNSSNRQPSELYSRLLTVDPTKPELCLSFEYIIEGNATQTIDVSLEEKGGKRRALASMTDIRMSEWRMKTLSLSKSHYLRPFTIYRVTIAIFLVIDAIRIRRSNLLAIHEIRKYLLSDDIIFLDDFACHG